MSQVRLIASHSGKDKEKIKLRGESERKPLPFWKRQKNINGKENDG